MRYNIVILKKKLSHTWFGPPNFSGVQGNGGIVGVPARKIRGPNLTQPIENMGPYVRDGIVLLGKFKYRFNIFGEGDASVV